MRLEGETVLSPAVKNVVFATLDATGLFRASGRLTETLRPRAHIRSVLYHETLPEDAGRLRAHFEEFARRFVPVTPDDLAAFLDGRWPHDRPGLIPCLDDGLRSNLDVALPILEEFGFTAWLFIPAGLIEPASEDDHAKFESFLADHPSHDDKPQIFPDWDRLKKVAAHHVVACHTMTHMRLGAEVPPDRLDREVRGAKQLMEVRLGRLVDVFAWVGGEVESRSADAERAIADAGFRFAFLTHKGVIRAGDDPLRLQRMALHPEYSMATVRFYLSGIPDLLAR